MMSLEDETTEEKKEIGSWNQRVEMQKNQYYETRATIHPRIHSPSLRESPFPIIPSFSNSDSSRASLRDFEEVGTESGCKQYRMDHKYYPTLTRQQYQSSVGA
jgi:hypothetical protein